MTHAVDRTDVSDPVRAALGALAECGRLSTGCAGSMIELEGMSSEVRAALDCADLCSVTERLLARHGGIDSDGAVSAAVDAAIAACSACAAACGAHAEHHAHCAAHARSATATAEALTALRRS
jgi:hypothetical protein